MTGRDPTSDLLERLMRHLQIRTIPPLDAEVVSQDSETGALELTLNMEDDTRAIWGVDSGYKDVPLLLGEWTKKISAGDRVALEFLDSDPRKPFVRGILSGTVTEATLTTSTKIALASAEVDVGQGAGPAAARVGDSVQITIAIGDIATAGGANTNVVTGHGTITAGSTVVKEA